MSAQERSSAVPRPVIFRAMPVALPQQAVYRRLGYRRASTRLGPSQEKMVADYMAAAMELIELQGAALRLPITGRDPGGVELAGGVHFRSASLAELLAASPEVLLMAATVGPEIMAAIGRDTAGGDLTRGVVFDATASEVVDAALDWIMARESQALLRERRRLTRRRYSAGYGDFGLEYQVVFHRLLMLEQLGVNITATHILVPEKSVTAIAGIEPADKPVIEDK